MKLKLPILIITIGVFLTLFSGISAQSSIPTITIDKPIIEMTIPELQAKIAEILQAIEQLQALIAQLTTQDGSGIDISRIPSSYTFNTNLTYGSSSNEVKYLQIILNADPDTRVSTTGFGSPGNESTYFGNKTKQAIIKFQAKYKIDISTIVGYTIKGTGYLGQGTRTMINQLLGQYRSGEVTSPPSDTPPDTIIEIDDGTYCGDNIIQTPNFSGVHEVCDNTSLNNQTCSTRGYFSGALSCSNTCLVFDTSNCLSVTGGVGGATPTTPSTPVVVQPVVLVCGDNTDNTCPSGCTYPQDTDCTYCGDNILQTPNDGGITEVCDNTSLNSHTCSTQGFPAGGTLLCSSTCLTFNTGSCYPPVPPNNAPILNPIGNQSTSENQEISFNISGTDTDNDTLAYSVQSIPSGATFTNQTFTWTPTYTQSGTYNVIFTLSDSSLTDTETITITVGNVNRAPTLDTIGDKSTNENQTITFTISGTDLDDSSLNYSIQNRPTGSSFNASTRTFTWTPSYEQSGTYNITFIVSDQEYTDQETITITVADVVQSYSLTTSTTNGSVSKSPNQATYTSGTVVTLTATPDSGYTFSSWSGDLIGTSSPATITMDSNKSVNANFLVVVIAPVCGDNTCNGTETCSSCSGDCGVCLPIECTNSIQDGDEQGIDCGGVCEFECPTNWKSGISVLFNGTPGIDYAEEYFYHDKLIDDHKVVYIKNTTEIIMKHNERNIANTEGTSYPIIGIDGQDGLPHSGDEGVIRYRVDRDLQIYKIRWADTGGEIYPAYTEPIAFNDMEYKPGVPVVGTVGDNGVGIADRSNFYSHGLIDEFGDEWHTLAYGDDDQWLCSVMGRVCNYYERWASDGKQTMFVVDPKTPLIYFVNKTPGAQFYTTPAKAYFVRKVHNQTTYITDNVEIKLVNIMDGDVYYRFGNDDFQKYNGAIDLGALSDGEHMLEYYYNFSHIKKRRIVKNPTYPSDDDTIVDCIGNDCNKHGYLMWRDENEFEKIKNQVLYGSLSSWYATDLRDDTSQWGGVNWDGADENLGKGLRKDVDEALENAFVVAIEGVNARPEHARYAKMMMLDNRMNMEPTGFEGNHVPNTTIEITYRGYYDVNLYFSNAFAYDILIDKYRSSQYSEGITPIEDYKIRDGLARYALEAMMELGRYSEYPWTADRNGMWPTARQIGALAIALAMPSYNTQYYGTSGFDGASASFEWVPYPEQKTTWKEAFYTEDNVMLGFPNQELRFGIHEQILTEPTLRSDGVTIPAGSFFDSRAYYGYVLMGHTYQILANIMKSKFDLVYPYLEMSFANSNNGSLYGFSLGDILPSYYQQLLLINERFPDLAQDAWNNIDYPDGQDCLMYSSGRCLNLDYLLYITNPYGYIFYHENWNETSECTRTDTSCGIWLNCQNCNDSDGCSGTNYRDYYCSGTSCAYAEDDCSDCSCSCGGYNVTESLANNNCSDGIDNDCDDQTDMADSDCGCTPWGTQPCNTGEQGICSSGTKTCQSNSTWGACIRNNEPITENCTDILDNDCNGQTDCNDSYCSADPVCQATGIPTDYISYWKFEGNADDSSSGNNNGILTGDATIISDTEKGSVLSLDGDGDYVSLGTPDNLQLGAASPFFITAWIYPKDTDTWDGIIKRGAPTSGGNLQAFAIQFYSGNTLRLSIGDGEDNIYTTTATNSITLNTWNFISCGINNSNYLMCFINGTSSGTPIENTLSTTYSAIKGTYIGTSKTDGTFFNGTIDDVMIYDRALTAQEIQDIYNAQKPGASPARRIIQTDDLSNEKVSYFASILSSIRSAIQDIMEKIKNLF